MDKPQASRSASAEIYIVGFKYKAPAKIDPQLLDIKHLFQGGKEPPKVIQSLPPYLHFIFLLRVVIEIIICMDLTYSGGGCTKRNKAKATP